MEDKLWLLTIDALDGQGTPVVLRFSSGEWNGDNDFYEPRIKQAGLFSEGLYSGDVLPANRSSFGVTDLINNDGYLNYLVDYAVDGRDLNISVVIDGSVIPVFRGVVQRLEFSRNLINIRLRSPAENLQERRNFNTYAGDNILPDGLEGTESDLKGNAKPRLYGTVSNFRPILVNTARLIYQVSDEEASVTAVFDEGVGLDDEGEYSTLSDLQNDSLEPSPGAYKTFQGYFRLGASPVGQITCDAESNTSLLGDCFARIADEAGVIVEDGVSVLNSFGEARLIALQEETFTSLLDRLVKSAGCYYRFLPNGNLSIGLIPTPSIPEITIEDWAILDISRSSSGAGGNGIPIWRVEVEADRVETVQETLSGSVSQERIARVSKTYRKEFEEDVDVKERHLLSEQFTITSDLASLTNANTVCNNLLDLLSVRRDTVNLTTTLVEVNDVDLLQTVRVQTDRLGYSEGRDMIVIEKTYDAVKSKLTLLLWG